jgi:hypothetical protein
VRVIAHDGRRFALTGDSRADRVNFAIERDRVTSVGAW